jgi:post-segregation antitoxin (ccd killing protein)
MSDCRKTDMETRHRHRKRSGLARADASEKTMRLILAAALSLCMTGVASAAAPFLTGPALGTALASGAVDADTVDFGALRYTPGQTVAFLSAQAVAQAAIAKAHDKPNIRALTDAKVCLSAQESAVLAGFNSALLAKDAEDWRAGKAEARAALAHYTEAKTAVLNGEQAPYPELQTAEDAMTRAAAAKQPELKALFVHDAQDQMWRRALLGSAPKAYAGDIGKTARALINAQLEAEGCATQAANDAWLSTTLDTVPWFTIDAYGKAADEAASNIARHADADPALQLKVLNRLGPLALAKRTDPKAFAALWDEVALSSGRPQRYGTQMRCAGKVWTARTPLEEPAQLDQRRGWVGLPPMRAYAASAAAVCGG